MKKKIYFKLVHLNPDHRSFQQQAIELVPNEPADVLVEIEANVLGDNGSPISIITPEELKRISDIFENAFSGEVRKVNNTQEWEDVGDTSSDEDGWPTINGD